MPPDAPFSIAMNDSNAEKQNLPENEALAPESARVAELEVKLAEATDRMLRALAETDNIRKRAEKERADTAKFAVTSFARDLLTVADNLRRALAAFPESERTANAAVASLYAGIEATERGLLKTFEGMGIRKIEPLGEPFNPNFHEVMFEADMPDKAPGTIIQLIDPGYMIHERLLRPARVGIAKGNGQGLQGGQQIDEEA